MKGKIPRLISIAKYVLRINCRSMINLIFDFGFNQPANLQIKMNALYFLILSIGIITTILRYITQRKDKETKVWLFDFLSIFITF